MKGNKVLLVLIFILAVIAIYYYFTKDSTTLDEVSGAKFDFAIEDTASIDKIFIADSRGKSVTLTKSERAWLVDDKYVARPDNIKLLMTTFGRIAVKSPVPKVAFDGVVRMIATSGTKVEIYQGDKYPAKTYYVGGPTQDHQGTYMLLESNNEKSTVPYVMHIPGFNGYLTTRFFTEAEQWRDAIVFKYLYEDIKSIQVDYHETPEQSFAIRKSGDSFVLLDPSTEEPVENTDSIALKKYIREYQKVYYEMIDLESKKEKVDSILGSHPFFTIRVESLDGRKDEIVSYHMPNYRGIIDPDGEEYDYDVDRMYGYLNRELFTFIQFATFDRITLPRDHFIRKE